MQRRIPFPALAASIMLSAAALIGLCAPADATVFIGLQQDAGAIVTVASSASGAASITNLDTTGIGGKFSSVSVTVTGQPIEPSPSVFDSTVIAIHDGTAPAKANAGTLSIYVTSTGNAGYAGMTEFDSAFHWDLLTNKSKTLPNKWTLTQSTYIDPDNGIFTTPAPPIGTTGPWMVTNSEEDSAVAIGSAHYSVTGVYRITAPSYGKTNAGIEVVDAVLPEPASLALLGAALGGFGIFARRRQRRA